MADASTNGMADTSSIRVVWLFNCIGTPGSLLYWNGILPPYLERFPNSWFFTARPPSKIIEGTEKSVDCVGSLRIPLGQRRGSYERQIVIGSPKIVGIVKRLNPDIVIVQEFLSFAAYLAIFRARLRGSKLLLLLESDPIRGIPSRNRRWSRVLRRWIAKRMDFFLTNNAAGKSYLVDELGVRAEHIHVQPYLVSEIKPVSGEHPESPVSVRDEADGRLVFLYVGQLIERKGLAELIRAVDLLPNDVRGKVRFRLVGDGAERSMLEELVRERGLESQFEFIGQVSYDALPSLYRAADAFVMPTLDDYRALVGFEALSYGLPLLHSVYDGAVSELVDEGINGTRCDPRDAQQFAARITWMTNHSHRFAEMGEFSMQRHQQAYTIPHSVDALETAMKLCLKSSQSEPDEQP